MSAECPRHPACGCAPASPDPCICPLTPAGEALLASGLMQADHPDAREMVASVERQAVARHREQADAEVARLREALLGLLEHHADVSCISTDADPWPEVCDEADERARAALGDRP